MGTLELRRGGGQNGNRNALKHGRFTKEAKQRRALLRTFRRRMKDMLMTCREEIARRDGRPVSSVRLR